jgi:hypothetical protein
MKIKSAILSFPPSGSPDITNYRLYYAIAPQQITYDSPFIDLGLEQSFDLATLPGVSGTDQVFNLGVSAMDDVGNESDMKMLENVSLDFAAPDAPGDLVITRF